MADGKLLCPTNACPDGFSCVTGHCWRGGVVKPLDGGSDLDADPGVDMSDTACAQPLCTPAASTGVCDPACQTGCGCHEKCSASSAGEAACVPILGQRTVGQSCSVMNYGAAGQDDNCAPGSVCLYPGGLGTGNGYCFTLCASDDACPGSRCVPRPVAPPIGDVTPTASVCDVPYNVNPCDPFVPLSGSGCTGAGGRTVCYLDTPDPVSNASRTVCEYAQGGHGNNDSCDWSRDCFAGFVCAVRGGVGFCVRPCDMAHGCVSGTGTCQPYGSTYGYCGTN